MMQDLSYRYQLSLLNLVMGSRIMYSHQIPLQARSLIWITGWIGIGLILPLPPVVAQTIVPAPQDTATLVNTTAPNQLTITGGIQSGANLFHSFQQFGLNQGQSVYFQSNPTVHNILSRVTGGNASVIDGLVGVTGSNANLYLLNPAGVLFGNNARVNVPGSLVVTTANGIGIGGRWFNAIGPNNYSDLAGNPTGFAFTMGQPGAIVNAGQLGVGAGQSLILAGGTVVSTGKLSAPEGQISIAAVPGQSLVRLSQSGQLLSLEMPLPMAGNLPNAWELPVTSLPELLTGGNASQATGLTVSNGVVSLSGAGLQIEPGDSAVRAATAKTVAISAQNHLTLANSQIDATGDIHLNAVNRIQVRDSEATPVTIRAGQNLTIVGQQGIDILALNHPALPIQSGGNLSLLSDGVISTDAHFASGGDFTVSSLQGGAAKLISLYDPVVSSNGNVTIAGSYIGASLKVEAIGNITFNGGITINAADAAAVDNNPVDQALLRGGHALILAAGRTTLDNPPSGSIPNLTNPAGPTTPGSILVGGPIASTGFNSLTVNMSARGNLVTQDMQTARGDINLESTNGSIQVGAIGSSTERVGSVTLAAPNGSITTGDMWASTSSFPTENPQFLVSLTSRDNIHTGVIDGVESIRLNSSAGNIVVQSISTRAIRTSSIVVVEITTPGLFQATGFVDRGLITYRILRVNIDAPENADIKQFLIAQAVLNPDGTTAPGNLKPDPNNSSGPRIPVVSSDRTAVVAFQGSPVSILVLEGDPGGRVRIRHGGQAVNTDGTITNPDGSKFVTIAGNGQTQFVVGPQVTRLPVDQMQIVPDYQAALGRDAGFGQQYVGPAVLYQTFSALNFGSAQFPVTVSGTVGSIATGAGSNTNAARSFLNVPFVPVVSGPTDNPGSSNNNPGGSVTTDSPAVARSQLPTSEASQTVQQQLNRQSSGGGCPPTGAIAAVPGGSRSGGQSATTSPCPTATKDSAQILRLLDGGVR